MERSSLDPHEEWLDESSVSEEEYYRLAELGKEMVDEFEASEAQSTDDSSTGGS